MLINKRGFTIIELLVVVSVIAILSLISVFGFNAVQAGTRDSQRSTRVTQLAEALEKYYAKNGEYPSCSALTSSATSAITTLSGLDPTVLVTPKAAAGVTNSIDPSCATLSVGGSTDKYAYVGDGSTTCATGGCLSYTLQYVEEGSNTIKSIASRHSTSINTSGTISTLAGSSVPFSSASLTWTALGNASSYTVQTSTVSNFASIFSTSSAGTNSATVTGLTPSTQYYFRVLPVSGGVAGTASNVVTITMQHIATPVVTATYNATNPTSQLDVSWAAITGAATYTLDYSTSSTFASGVTTLTGLTGTTTSVTGLATGTTLYFRLKAVAPDDTSSYSNTVNATTIVPAPATLTATTNSSTQITLVWGAVGVATTYNIEFALNSSFTGSSMAATGVTGTTRAITGLIQGQIYYFRVYALVGAVSSAASPSANATTSVDVPGAPGITAYRPGAIRPYASGYWVAWIDSPASGNWYYAYANIGGSCPAGTTSHFNVESNYNSPATAYYTGDTTATQWFMVQPTSSYHIKFQAQQYCQGANTASGWSGWNASCASGSGSTEACFF